jgi:SAM-dependent methyltransferase
MTPDPSMSFARYLEAKRTVDDRALNARVWDRLAAELSILADTLDRPLEVLEIGGGVGTMVERLRYGAISGPCNYVLLDSDPDLIDAAQIRLFGNGDFALEFVTADAFAYLETEGRSRYWDLIVANAVLDLTDLTSSIPALLDALHPDGLLYASINYDGMTTFAPAIEPALDVRIERLYNAAMHKPLPDGTIPVGSRSGRELIPAIRSNQGSVLEAGASDWVVFADHSGYHADEEYFLQHILWFVEETLIGHPEVDQEAFTDWLATRNWQVRTGELVYIAHQLDVLASRQKSGPGPD